MVLRSRYSDALSAAPDPGRGVALCFPGTEGAFARIFPNLRWQSGAGGVNRIVQDLENRRSRLTLAPVTFDCLPALVREGWLRPLDTWFTAAQLAAYTPTALALATVGGRLYTIPDDITPFVFFIRKKVLDRLRLEPPRTWDEFGVMADLLSRSGHSLILLKSGERSRLGFLLSLLGSNGVAADSGVALLQASRKIVEAYDWLMERLITPGLMVMDDLVYPNFDERKLRGHAGGFGWLSYLELLPADQLRQYVFLPFPRGPSLGGSLPRAPFKGNGWCVPWIKDSPDAAVAVLRSIHDRTMLRAMRIAERRPFLAVRPVWEDPGVRRRYPLYRYAAELLEGAEPMLSSGHEHYRRLEVTFRNALLERLHGFEWMDDYMGADPISRRGAGMPIRTVLRAIESLAGSVRGVKDVARILRIQPVTLRRLFQREMREGITPYFRRRKMEIARKLLQEQGLMTKEVAARTGFRDANAFTRAYSKFWGIPPTVDRKASRKAATP